MSPGLRLRTLGKVINHLGAGGKTGIINGTEIRVRRPAAGRNDRDRFISGKSKQNAIKTMVVTDSDGRVLCCSPAQPGSCADITRTRQLGLVKLLAEGPVMEVRTGRGDARAATQGSLLTADAGRARHSPLKNWRALARHLGRREHMRDTVQAIAGLLSHQQTADLTSPRRM
ncbi:transposase family protein [Streptomyces pilosus]|uniref:transposase family protein n=1 Tax=Streptomyces pilosus TaxID=28893 RepID=UPI00363A92C2